MTDAAKQHKTPQNRLLNLQKSSYPAHVTEIIAGLFESFRKLWRQRSPYKWCRRATVAQVVAKECSNSSLSPCRPATGRRQSRQLRYDFEHPVAAAHELESNIIGVAGRATARILRM